MKKIQTEQEFHERMRQLLEYRIGDMQPFRHKPVEESADEELIDGLMEEDEEEGDAPAPEKKADKPKPKAQPENKPAPKPKAKPEKAPEQADTAVVDPEQELSPVSDEPAPAQGGPAPEAETDAITQKLNTFQDFMQSTAQTLASINDRLAQIGDLGVKVDKLDHEMKEINPSPEETYDLISKHSYPYNLKLSDVWSDYFEDTPGEADATAPTEKEYTADVEEIEQSMSDHEVQDSFYRDEEDQEKPGL